MEKSKFLKPLFLVIVVILLYYGLKRPPKQFDFDEELHPTLPSGNGITKEHAIHFYEVFLDIFLNKHNYFAEHAENVYLLNYILRDDKKWRVTESAIFDMFDITDNDYINKNEFESFADLFPGIRERQMIDSFRMLIDRNVDTKITRVEWINFCNKNLRPKLLQDLQEWESNHSPLPNPNNITGQFTAKTKEERNHRDLIHGQLNKALTLFHDGFKAFIHHHQNRDKHPIEDPDMFVRRIGYWILERFERWDALYMWIYQLLDDDGNGEITPKEMSQQLQVFGVSNIHVREMFEYFDENGDSIIQRSEYNDFSETIRRLLGNHFK